MYPYIYLASQSPRRQELLKQIGVQFEMLTAEPHEDTETLEIPIPHEKAHDYVKRVTLAKSTVALDRWSKSKRPWAPILCADTTVSLPSSIAGEILGKPIDTADAVRILEMLSGKVHEVLTAVVLLVEFPHMCPAPKCLTHLWEGVGVCHLCHGRTVTGDAKGEHS